MDRGSNIVLGGAIIGMGLSVWGFVHILRRTLPRCPICGHWTAHWCNYFDWYGDGLDCDRRKW